jgi:hypothetical protein
MAQDADETDQTQPCENVEDSIQNSLDRSAGEKQS